MEKLFPVLEKHGSLAESYLYSDPNSCLYKLGLFAETVVNYMFELDKLPQPEGESSSAGRIKILKREGLLPKQIDDILFELRIIRNKAVHDAYESVEKCKTMLQMAHTLAIWFMQTYGDWEFNASNFVLTSDQSKKHGFSTVI